MQSTFTADSKQSDVAVVRLEVAIIATVNSLSTHSTMSNLICFFFKRLVHRALFNDYTKGTSKKYLLSTNISFDEQRFIDDDGSMLLKDGHGYISQIIPTSISVKPDV